MFCTFLVIYLYIFLKIQIFYYFLEEKNSKLSHFLEDSKLVSLNDKKLIVELLNGNQFQQDSLEKDLNQIENVFNELFKDKLLLLCNNVYIF